MEIKTLNSQEEILMWDEYILKNINCTFYHFLGWKEIIEKSFGYKAIYLMAKSDNLKGVLPLFYIKSPLSGSRLVSLPMADYGGVCADNVEAENLLIKEAIKITQKYKAGYLELRHINAKDSASLYTKIHKQTFILDLCQDFSFLWNNFIPEIRNRIKKAQKSGLEIKIGGRELLDNFYFIYSFHMKELGTPVLGKVFFKNMCLKFPKNTKIFIVHHQGVLMGVALIIFFKDTIEVPWISSLGKYFPYCPNNLMYWEIIKYGCQQGFKYFDFGRSTKDSSHALFKTRWGARPVDLSWQYYSSNINRLPKISPDNPRFGLAINIWKKLPLLLTNSIGPKIARHLPY